MKVLNVVGARPNFVKMASLLAELKRLPGIKPVVVHTDQHYDAEMSDIFFQDLGIPRPDYSLQVGPASHAVQAAEVMKRLEPVLTRECPDVVVVVGDVNSTMAASLAAVKLGIPVAHVESGLRSFDRTMPEEINRVVTDAVADLLFVSEPSGVENLLREGRPRERIFLVGNIMIDTLQRFLVAAQRTAVLDDFGLRLNNEGGSRKYTLLTLHRPALVDSPEIFRRIWEALQDIAREAPIIFPVHPRTRQRIQELGFEGSPGGDCLQHSGGIRMIPPLGYLEFLHLQSAAALVITDSGGVQEETTALGVPCVTVRETTERPITVAEGTNTLVGYDPSSLCDEAKRALTGRGKKGRMPRLWDGQSARRIANVLCEHGGASRGRRSVPQCSVAAVGPLPVAAS